MSKLKVTDRQGSKEIMGYGQLSVIKKLKAWMVKIMGCCRQRLAPPVDTPLVSGGLSKIKCGSRLQGSRGLNTIIGHGRQRSNLIYGAAYDGASAPMGS